MDLNGTRLFVEVVKAGSLSAAAQRTGVPLPTLSRRIRDLERELKVQLLERSVRGTRLTDAGTRLYELAARGIETLAEAEQAVRSDQAHLRGRLRLSIPTAFAPWWDLLAEFQREYPAIELAVYTTDRRIDHAQDGIDVALRVGTIVHEAMVARRLLLYRHVLVASPKLLRRLGTPEAPASLHGYPCAVWCRDANSRSVWNLGEHVVEPAAVLTSNDYLHLRALALAGAAITELPPFLAVEGLRGGELVEVLSAFRLPEQEINLLYPSHRNPSSLVRAYLDFCQKRVRQFVEIR